MEGLQAQDPAWYNKLVVGLSEEQKKALNEVFVLALQRKAAAGRWHLEEVEDTVCLLAELLVNPPMNPPMNVQCNRSLLSPTQNRVQTD